MSLVYFLIVLSVLVMVHEFGHFIAAKRIGVRVEKFSLGFGPKLFSVKRGDTEYLISAIPLGGYIKMAGDEPGEALKGEKCEFLSRNAFDRFKIIIAGPLFNYILAFVLLVVVFMAGNPVTTTEIGMVLDGYPAKQAGILVGDKVLAIDGKKISYGEVLVKAVNMHGKRPMILTIDRQGIIFDKEIRPVVEKRKIGFDNKEVEIARIGIQPLQKIEKGGYGFFGSVYMGAQTLWQITIVTYKALWNMILGKLSVKGMTGPIGIFMFTAHAAKLGIIYLINFMALLSASLAIFNLLPFPVLDGGHILFLFVEKLRGKPLSVRAQESIANIGVGLLILLTVFIFYNDIVKFGVFDRIGKLFKR
ncbi:MAG: RIP metalloprotease RseP [Candidatus Omnitrophica bacterium]|nr:RIP metalloprotease RseP [Candidatus Omnitrophota bacterium]